MGVNTDLDLRAEFFDGDDFAEPFVVHAPDGSTREVMGIFTSADEAVDLGRAGIESAHPMLEVVEDDLTGMAEAVRLTRNKTGQGYSVRDIRPDGNGCAMLSLMETST